MENFNEQDKRMRNLYLSIVFWHVIKAQICPLAQKTKHLNCLSSVVQVLHLSVCKSLRLVFLPNLQGIQKEVFSYKMTTLLGSYFPLHLRINSQKSPDSLVIPRYVLI